jgi:hypothetical protein
MPNTNAQKFGKLVKTINGNSPSSEIPALVVGDEIITDTITKCEHLNNFLANQCSVNDKDSMLLNTVPDMPPFQLKRITAVEVNKYIGLLNKGKATGPDGISNMILSKVGSVIAEPFSNFFNFSIETGTFPTKWKTSNITPVYKNKGDKSDVKNYRPISLLCFASKLFEKVIAGQLTVHLQDNHLLYEKQAGFQSGDSTVNQLVIYLQIRGRERCKSCLLGHELRL